MLRTHTCGELRVGDIGKTVKLSGWVDTLRDHGGLTFVDLRDRYGKTQLVMDAAAKAALPDALRSEACVQAEGRVQARPAGTENPKLATGQIEVAVQKVTLLNACDPLPFEVPKSLETNEDLRLKYRFLDLRNPDVQKNLFARHRMFQICRRALDARGFIEVETPILTKSTPEGARDYLVPSRVNSGEFYALPQSPQLFKQILMVAGFDRYFQIAKCFRDEDLRADRQPEFTQLDVEMSFLDEEDLFEVIEGALTDLFGGILNRKVAAPFARLTYQDAMDRYGSDKPDLRFGLEIRDVSGLLGGTEFKVFKDTLASGGTVRGLCLAGGASLSRKDIDDLTEFAKAEGALGLAYFKVEEGRLESPIAKFVSAETQQALIGAFGASAKDLLLFVADKKPTALKVLGALRLRLGRSRGLIPADAFAPAWITDFPLFKHNEEENRWESEHHPFTAPHEEDWRRYRAGEIPPDRVRSRAYDLVLNGNEIASGSVRIHNESRQKEIFDAIGLKEEEIALRFGFLLKAFKFGAPPHGGIALGLDRVLTILLGLDSIREVIAFPKNQKAVCPMTDAPSPVSERQLKELGVKLR